MRNAGAVEMGGTIREILRSERFSVLADDGCTVFADVTGRLADRMRDARVGDRVTIRLDLGRPVPARIIEREDRAAADADPAEVNNGRG